MIDEFTELESLEFMLKRLGFDVLAVGKEVLVADALLRFPPDLAMITYKGRSIDGFRAAAKIKVPRTGFPPPRVALIWSKASGMSSPRLSSENASLCDALVEGPLEPYAVIQILARLLLVDEDVLIKKYERASGQPLPVGPSNANSLTSQNLPAAAQAPSSPTVSREDRYKAFLAAHDEPVTGTLSRKVIREEGRKIAEAEGPVEKAENEKILADKREFAARLLKKPVP